VVEGRKRGNGDRRGGKRGERKAERTKVSLQLVDLARLLRR
jgi:hypothetical protein